MTSTTSPVNAATVEAWVYYVCPVAGAREVMLESDPDLANNPLIFPPDDYVARLHQFRATTAEEEAGDPVGGREDQRIVGEVRDRSRA